MNNEERKRYLNKVSKQEERKASYLSKLVIRTILSIILFLVASIIVKTSNDGKTIIYKSLYENNFSFTSVKKFYEKYLGGISILDNLLKDDVVAVFNENLVYSDKNKYLEGVELAVTNKYLVPSMDDGIVVYIGEKEGYGNVVIVQTMQGIDTWYGNLDSSAVTIYDYVAKGTVLGEASNNKLYLVFSKEGMFLNYEEYLK